MIRGSWLSPESFGGGSRRSAQQTSMIRLCRQTSFLARKRWILVRIMRNLTPRRILRLLIPHKTHHGDLTPSFAAEDTDNTATTQAQSSESSHETQKVRVVAVNHLGTY